MTKKEYNGWYNYETWLVNLWMGNVTHPFFVHRITGLLVRR
jgi:hypothetical protein